MVGTNPRSMMETDGKITNVNLYTFDHPMDITKLVECDIFTKLVECDIFPSDDQDGRTATICQILFEKRLKRRKELV